MPPGRMPPRGPPPGPPTVVPVCGLPPPVAATAAAPMPPPARNAATIAPTIASLARLFPVRFAGGPALLASAGPGGVQVGGAPAAGSTVEVIGKLEVGVTTGVTAVAVSEPPSGVQPVSASFGAVAWW